MFRLSIIVSMSWLALSSIATAQPARIYVEGGSKQQREELLRLLRSTSDLTPVPYGNRPEANINLQKSGGAKVKCGDAKAFLPGPNAAEIVQQFRTWLRSPLEARRSAYARRAEAIGAAVAAFAAGLNSNSTAALAPAATTKLMLFGGENHKTFLGCLNCSEYDAESVLNQFGTFGSKYSATSIFNRYGEFGSRYGQYSACNPYANDPPVVVDPNGGFHGRLTINAYISQRIADERLRGWIAGVCGG